MARDAFHNAVQSALEKEGWQITNDPLRFEKKAQNSKLTSAQNVL
jgi:hypothetical protein